MRFVRNVGWPESLKRLIAAANRPPFRRRKIAAAALGIAGGAAIAVAIVVKLRDLGHMPAKRRRDNSPMLTGSRFNQRRCFQPVQSQRVEPAMRLGQAKWHITQRARVSRLNKFMR